MSAYQRNEAILAGSKSATKTAGTLSQEWPRNSLTEAAFWAYINGENQYPQIHHFGILSVTATKIYAKTSG